MQEQLEGLDAAIERGIQNKKTGADAVFVEAPRSLDEMKKIGKEIKSPLVANMIEGGATPMKFSTNIKQNGIQHNPISIISIICKYVCNNEYFTRIKKYRNHGKSINKK